MPATGPHLRYRFGRFELQPQERRLLENGVPVDLRPRALDLLSALVQRAGHLVGKDELFREVWPRVVVDDSALQVQVSALRKVLGKAALATVSGSGYRFVMAVGVVEAQPEPSTALPRHNLPLALTSFVGREAALTRLAQSLARARLLTLTGAGGCGKTRLALQAAAAVLDRYPDGVWLVELAALADASLVPQAAMAALALEEAPGVAPMQTLTAHLASRKLLLLLDNAEHLLAGCAALCDALLRDCPAVTLLVTSREKLGLVGELSYRVPSLSVPDAAASPEALLAAESARLFVDRARLLKPHFSPTPQNAAALAAICRRLDGIPLAIELAAGRMRAMSAEELSQRLDQRFSLLAGASPGSHPAQSRHRTLRSLIDWSFDLLSEAEQALLCRLSVFAGGCTLQAAEAVCSERPEDVPQVLDLLAALSDKSLLVAEDQAHITRYRLLETVLAYARERLQERGEAARWHDRHVVHFVALAETAWPHLRGPDKRTWVDTLAADQDNLRAALAWSLAVPERTESGLRLVAALVSFWLIRGQLSEGRRWHALALSVAPQDGDPALRATVLNRGGILAFQQGDLEAARPLFAQAIAIDRQLGNQVGMASALSNLGGVVLELGDLAEARALQEESAALFRVLGDQGRLAQTLLNLGSTALAQEDWMAAQAALSEAVAIMRSLGDHHGVGNALGPLAVLATQRGEHAQARGMLLEALAIFGETGDPRETAELLEELAHVESLVTPDLRAARLWGAAEQLRTAAGTPLPRNELATHAKRVAAARLALADDAAFDRAWREGAAMSLAQALQALPI
ncbi:MAG TPA: tetratricopeptide repeat protein [Ideonella sp.]|uniref:ATP-binding protein n=1 Tax=Ideonella sp. TaxID=1929293 RepID=UPI002CD4B3BA|nr:tetratricopeptide repeat protein [Ideonella sp.]HSI48597.1 tetratricopeptide repeat protein [Ideonella sp.]